MARPGGMPAAVGQAAGQPTMPAASRYFNAPAFGSSYQTPMQQQQAAAVSPRPQLDPRMLSLGAQLFHGSMNQPPGQTDGGVAQLMPLVMQAFRKK